MAVNLPRHHNLIAWAKERGLFVRVDRATPWGNPFVIGRDGDREALIAAYRDHYLPFKPSLLGRTVVAMLGGLAVLVGAVIGGLTLRETSRQNRAAIGLQHRGQVTERFTRAIDQLGQSGNDKLEVRVGAIYALEQIARDSAELHWPIMEVLTTYLRVHCPGRGNLGSVAMPKAGPTPKHRLPDADAIITVIRRRISERKSTGQHLDLREVDLRYVAWSRIKPKSTDEVGPGSG